jgi:hypothetical protein
MFVSKKRRQYHQNKYGTVTTAKILNALELEAIVF